MRTRVRNLTALSLFLASVGLAFGGEDDARAIVEKSIKALGGETNLAKHNALTIEESGTYYGMGNGLPYTSELKVQWPGQFRMDIKNVFTIVLNDDKGWIAAGGDVKEMTGDQLATQRHDHKAGYMATLVPLKDKAFTLKTLADAKVDKADCKVVQASRKDYPEVTLSFDKATHYLVRVAYKTKSAEQEFKEVSMETTYSKYKEVDGVQTPHKMAMKRDGEIFVESEITSLKAEGKLDAKVFAMPK